MRSISKIIGKTFQLTSLFVILSMVIFVAACGSDDEDTLSHNNSTLKGVIRIDGSSTVYPLSEAVAEDYGNKEKDVKLNVSVSGTGGGFKRFCPGETDISNASRPIKDKEINMCNENNVDYIELIIALDGLSIMVSPQNEFVDCLTMQELNNIWKPESLITNWKDIRDGFPDKKLDLYGPDTDSGTFDYFTDDVNGETGVSRADYTASADDNVLVTGITGSSGSLGYFGYAYYIENKEILKAIGVDAGDGCVFPSNQTIVDGTYPLSRPIFIYVNKNKLINQEHLYDFVDFYIENVSLITSEVGYIPLDSYDSVRASVNSAFIK
tara:strand:+ start:4965 stop:5936 length:972 start_codon:yes stop_codon:yes gene_type:complete